MHDDIPLISTTAMAFVLACVLGFAAHRLRLPPLVGYLLAGVVIGPFSPGFVADTELAGQLAEMGVILLMFGVGLHFSIGDLMAVRGLAVPGAIVQIAIATAMGAGLALAWGWSIGAGLVFGLSLSVASTIVLLRALEERNALSSATGRIAVGWLIVEDLVMVLTLVLLPASAEVLGGHLDGGVTAHSEEQYSRQYRHHAAEGRRVHRRGGAGRPEGGAVGAQAGRACRFTRIVHLDGSGGSAWNCLRIVPVVWRIASTRRLLCWGNIKRIRIQPSGRYRLPAFAGCLCHSVLCLRRYAIRPRNSGP